MKNRNCKVLCVFQQALNSYFCHLSYMELKTSGWSFLKIRRSYIENIILVLWAILAVYGMMHHEIWRDEMRALSIAIQSESILDLPGNLINEGHPVLWYFILKIGFLIFNSNFVLPVFSILTAFAIAYLLIKKSPFPLWFSALIIFGPWCLYDYGINARNYAIGALFMLLFAFWKRNKPQSVFPAFVFLALAVQSNVYSAMLCMMLSAWLLMESYLSKQNLKPTLFGTLLVSLSFLFALYVTMPDSSSIVLVSEQQNLKVLSKIWDVGFGFISDPIGILYVPFKYGHGLLTAIFWLSLLVFVSKPRILLFVFLTEVLMSFFALYYRMNYLQHWGIWVYIFLLMYWINYDGLRLRISDSRFKFVLKQTGLAVFSLLMLSNVYRCYADYSYDIHTLRSDSKDFGKWFKKNIKADDIIIAEPDYVMESAMYYNYHPYYLPREKRFNTYVHFTTANNRFMSLENLHHIADSFKNTGKTTYLILGKFFTRDTLYRYSYNRQYKVDQQALMQLNSEYELLDSFNNNWYCDEHYFIYKRK